MMDNKVREILVALLHDVGKIAVRADIEKDIWQASKNLLSVLNLELEVLFDKFLKELDSKNSKTALAHRIGGFNFSDETEFENANKKSSIRLKNPFFSLKLFNILEPAKLFEDYKPVPSFFSIAPLELKPNIPSLEAYEPCAVEIYKNIWSFLVRDFQLLKERGIVSLDSILQVLKRYTYFVPAWIVESEKGAESICDFSLYHHLKLTAAAISVLSSAKNLDKPFSLLVGKLLGLKNFLFGLSNDAQLDDVFGRYLYALSIVKSSALCVAEKLGLSSVNIILENGFEFVLFSTASEDNVKTLNSFEKTLNRWFFEKSLPLFIRIFSVDFSAEEAQKNFGAVWERANRFASFGSSELEPMDFKLRSYENSCVICLGEVEDERTEKTCDFCRAFKELGNLFVKGEKVEIGSNLCPDELAKKLADRKLILGGITDSDLLGDSILLSAFGYAKSFSFDGKSTIGHRLGALVIGFDHGDILFDPRTSDEPISLAKATVILDSLNIFLTHYSNWIASSFEEELGGILPVKFGAKGERRLIGFALPDGKLAMIGSLSDVLGLGVDMRRVFRAFVGEGSNVNQFGLSAGICDAEPSASWKFLLLKAEELFRLASEPDKAYSFLVPELPERFEPRKVCDSVVAFLQSNPPTAKGAIRPRISWAELEKDILPLIQKWYRAHLASPAYSKQLLTRLWNVFNMWRFDGVFAFSKLEEAVGKLKGKACGEFDELLDMVYSFASRNMEIFYFPLSLFGRIVMGR